MSAPATHRSAEEIGRTPTGPRPLPPLGRTREVPLPEVVTETLPSGLRVLVARRAGVPMAEVRLRVPFAAPGGVADPGFTARAELLASGLFTGTARHDRVELDDALAGVGADVGASVDPERLLIHGSGLAEGLPEVLGLLGEVLTGATYPESELLRERERLVERISVARAQPRTVAREALQRKRFGTHPIALEMPTGEAVAAVEPAAVRALHAAGVVPRGSTLVVVGDLEPAAALAAIREALGGWESAGTARELEAPPVPPAGPLELVHRPGSVQSQLRLTAPALRRDAPGYAAFQLANLVFGGYFSSRWMENVREDKGYTYGAHSGPEFVPGGAVLGVETDVASDVTAAALLETRYELGRMVAVPPTAEEIDAARRYAIGSLLISLDSQGGLASTLASLDSVGLTVDWLRERPVQLEAVTTEEVAAAALEYFAPERFTGVIVGDADAIGARLRALGGIG